MVAFASPLDYSTEDPEDEVMLFLICFVFGAVHPRVKKSVGPSSVWCSTATWQMVVFSTEVFCETCSKVDRRRICVHDGNAAWETRCLSDETGVLLVDLPW